ncbi:unnamed protein product [Ceutorhynchus assimilis]|uniref:TBC1 domain family member 31 n=1 Tax=Ceutorhynchus assimilis TaxID=467358 RepID=A0A9N9MNG0_9CUCU|nr:unnamed protein product [Ceutorhynchus assimilis]
MGSLDVAKELTTDISKKIFKLKPPDSNGLLLNILTSNNKKAVRFLHCSFQNNGNILALASNDEQIYIIDFLMGKFWKLKKLDSRTYIKFSECNDSQLLVGKSNGVLEILHIDSGNVLAKLLGHLHSVVSISFTQNNRCLSSSKYEAIIWDLFSYTKLQVLSLEVECVLKFVLFVPVSNHILVCYNDDIIQIWQHSSFENLKQFHPSNWRNHSVRSLSFTKNGKIMAVSGFQPILAIFQLDIWKLLKIINLPEYINSVRKIQFISQHFDGGCNKLIAILSGNGIIYFYNVEENFLISKLNTKGEIVSFSIPHGHIQYISCLLCTGEVEVYDMNFYLMKNQELTIVKAQDSTSKVRLRNFCRKDTTTKLRIENILEIDKLKSIIQEYREFPEAYRSIIWEKILKLPNNRKQYNTIVNHMGIVAFDNLQQQFPLEDKVTIRCLRHVLNNIVTWCPFFAEVDYLPCFLFPFVKVFHKKPVSCFELCCTIIINWCQHWFEYHPLPPVNILAMIDNMLMEHDALLLQHFSLHKIKPILYSWSLLETAFSELLTTQGWLMFWDHVFINEPAFLLCAVIAYLMLQRKQLLVLTKAEDFLHFFYSQRPLDTKTLITKTYHILNHTSSSNHPRQYLSMFTCLTCGSYPIFDEYPKEVVNFQVEHMNHLDHQLKETKSLRETILREKGKQTRLNEMAVKNEEDRRMIEVEKAAIQKIKSYQQNLLNQQEELKAMRQELIDQEEAIIENTQKMYRGDIRNAGNMEILTNGIDVSGKNNKIDINNLQEAYKLEQLDLLRKNQNLKLDRTSHILSPDFTDQLSSAHKKTMDLKEMIKNAKIGLEPPRKADVVLTIAATNELIDKIKLELENERFLDKHDDTRENMKVKQLEKETEGLQKEISQLLRVLSEKRSEEVLPAYSSASNGVGPNKTVRFSKKTKR